MDERRNCCGAVLTRAWCMPGQQETQRRIGHDSNPPERTPTDRVWPAQIDMLPSTDHDAAEM
jgi:hypothetical protein